MDEMYNLSDLSMDPNADIISEFRLSVGDLMGTIDTEPMNMPPPPMPMQGMQQPQAGMQDLASLAGGMPQSPQMQGLTQQPPADPLMQVPQAMTQPSQQSMGPDPMSQMSPNPNLM